MSRHKWQARLATAFGITAEPVKTFLQPDHEDEGYYRKPVTEPKLGPNGKTNGQRRVTGYIPVAYFLENGRLVGIIGDRDMTDQEVTDEQLWSYVVKNPIPYEWYHAVADNGEPWPDQEKWTSPVPARMSDNQSTEPVEEYYEGTEDDVRAPEEPPKPRHQVLADAIKAEIEAAPKKVQTLDQANLANGAKNKIAELRLTGAREGKAIYEPPRKEYERLYAIWTPMIKTAETAEKALTRMVLTFQEDQRKMVAAAAAEAARIQREQDEANERNAQRAIARGDVEPPPVAEAAPAVQPAPAPVQPTYGTRTIKAEVKKFAVVNDYVAAFTYFKDDPELRARIEKLATDAIRAGAVIPGVTHREGLL